ncbi:MAG TPA: tetratricopeptide repeat protein [Methylophilaceae bacterium]|nr:tetratricopeptide repeat protein [Methylophilaceae bacterium]
MAYDLEEQEQIDEFKAWWKQYGKTVSSLVIGLVVAYAAYQIWNYVQHKQAIDASTQFQELTVIDQKDLKAIQAKSASIMEQYSGTPYAARAALFAAKANYAAKDTKSAKAQLDWAIKNAEETATRAMATLQLANILAEEKDYDSALKLLEAKHDAGFEGLFADLKGDLLMLQGKRAEAKAAYELALSKLDAQGKYRVITQRKLEALG